MGEEGKLRYGRSCPTCFDNVFARDGMMYFVYFEYNLVVAVTIAKRSDFCVILCAGAAYVMHSCRQLCIIHINGGTGAIVDLAPLEGRRRLTRTSIMAVPNRLAKRRKIHRFATISDLALPPPLFLPILLCNVSALAPHALSTAQSRLPSCHTSILQ